MSKRDRKERKVNALSDLSTVVDVASLPVVVEQQMSYPVAGLRPVFDDQLPATEIISVSGNTEETGAPQSADAIPLPETEETEIHPVEEVIPDEPVTDAVAETIAESSTVEEVAEAFVEPVAQTHEVRVQPEVEHPEDLPNEPPSPEPDKSEEPVVAAKEIPKAALELIEALQAQINLLKTSKASRKVASGSKARPNVTYTLLAKPPAWHSTPQVAQLQQILFDPAFLEAHRQTDGSVKVSEPDLFAQVVAGHAAGILRTRQEPIRILQYYRSDLLNANCLRWQ